jgi:hypothetical protein
MNNSLLEKAQRDYPIGTEYIGIRDGNIETVNYTPRWVEGQDGNIEGGFDYIYRDGEWAKIVMPKKFDIGKWYRNTHWQSKAGKFESYNDDRVSFSEYISAGGKHMYFNFENPSSDTFIEVPLSEIQQYLPINHLLNQENKTVMTQQILTVAITEVLKIHSIACSSWKSIIANAYLPRVDNAQNITFNQHEIDAMFKAATETQLPTLENIFGKQVKEPTLKDIADGKPLFRENPNDGTTAMIEVRIGEYSNLKDKAFWLNTFYNWELKKDNEGVLCLVPTPKR